MTCIFYFYRDLVWVSFCEDGCILQRESSDVRSRLKKPPLTKEAYGFSNRAGQAYGDGDYKALQRANAQNGHVSWV
jgi:hypothetical protein